MDLLSNLKPGTQAYFQAASAKAVFDAARAQGGQHAEWADQMEKSLTQLVSGANPQNANQAMQSFMAAMQEVNNYQKNILPKPETKAGYGAPELDPNTGMLIQRALDNPKDVKPVGTTARDDFGPVEFKDGVMGQINKRTGEFKQIRLPQGTQTTVNRDGTVTITPVTVGAGSDKMAAAEAQQKELAQQKGDPTLAEVARVITGLKEIPQGEGVVGSTIRMAGAAVPMSQMGQLETRAKAIKSTLSLDYMQKMRLGSPTGGLMGAVSDAEGKKLETMMGALEANLPPQERATKFRQIAKFYTEVIHGTDEKIDALVKAGKITPQMAEKAKAEREEAYLNAATGNASFFEPKDPAQTQQVPAKVETTLPLETQELLKQLGLPSQ